MGRLLSRALEQAGLTRVARVAMEGAGLSGDDLARMRSADTLLLAGLADQVRKAHRGERVRVFETASSVGDSTVRLDLEPNRVDGPTGEEILREVALLRLSTPAARSVAVSLDSLGLELAQTALLFGADCLLGDLGGKRTLPLLDGPAARRNELTGLLQRAGRNVEFVQPPAPALERTGG